MKKFQWGKKTNALKDHRLTFGEFVWYGFNFVCGITFVPAFYTWFSHSGGGEMLHLGYHMIWILLIEGMVAGTAAWAFAKLSRVHAATDGAAYVYTRTSLNPLMGWLVSVCLYMTLPLVITSQIVSMVRINFVGGEFSANFGSFRNLYLDLIGMGIYGIASCAILLGLKVWKQIFSKIIYIKWMLTIVLIIGAFTLMVVNKGSGFVAANHDTAISVRTFSSAFASCFFFFLGFETFSTMSRNVKNPETTIPKGLVCVLAIITTVMILVTTIFIGALYSTGFLENPAIQVWTLLGNKLNSHVLGIVGGILMVICFISIQTSASMANSLYSGSVLTPIAKEGYISEKYSIISSDNLGYKAILLNLKITLSLLLFWLILPDLINGLAYGSNNTNGIDTFSYTDFTSLVSVMDILVCALVVFVALKLSFNGKLKTNAFEVIAWVVLFCFLIWQFVEFFIKVYHLYEPNDGSPKLIIKPTIQVVYFLGFFTGIFLWYYTYYLPKRKFRKKNDPKRHKELESEFRLIDDWNYIATTLNIELKNYIKRNKKLFRDESNPNLTLAKEMSEILSQHDKINSQVPDTSEKLAEVAKIHKDAN